MKLILSQIQYLILLKLFLILLVISPVLISSPASAQAQDPASIKFKIFYPPTVTLTPSPSPILFFSNTPSPDPNVTITKTPPDTVKHCVRIAEEAVKITSVLEHGFWNYLNKSPLYPELWDQAYYELHPNVCLDIAHSYPPRCTGDRPGAFQMFWCTWTPMKSYLRAGLNMPQDLYSTIVQKPWFASQGRYLPADTTFDKLQIGSVVFFRFSYLTVTKHVAIITGITRDYITTHESNGLASSRALTVGLDGKIQSIGTIVVDGFGIPPAEC